MLFFLTIFDVFGASVLLPLVGLVPRYEIIKSQGERSGLMVRASASGSGDPGSILGRVGVLFP